jgi:hypothetical protein
VIVVANLKGWNVKVRGQILVGSPHEDCSGLFGFGWSTCGEFPYWQFFFMFLFSRFSLLEGETFYMFFAISNPTDWLEGLEREGFIDLVYCFDHTNPVGSLTRISSSIGGKLWGGIHVPFRDTPSRCF